MKNIFCIIVSLTLSLFLYSQKTRTITFYNNNEVLADVKIYYQNNFITNSNSDGICEISDTINIVRCNYLDLIDTIINLKNQNSIKVYFKINLIKNVDITSKYDAKKHLIKLLEMNDSISAQIDTTLYYKVLMRRTMPKIGKIELFEGIIKRNEHIDGWSYIVKIDNYYNDITMSNAPEMPRKDTLYGKIMGFGVGLYEHYNNYQRKEIAKKKYKIENIFQQNDSTIFKISYIEKGKKQKYDQQRNYYFFENNIIRKVEQYDEYSKNRYKIVIFDFTNISRYEKVEYENNKIINIKSRNYKNETFYHNINQTVISEVFCEIIPNPNLEFEINKTMGNLKISVLSIKKQYPNLIIPSNPEPFYKFDF